jgi:hypothetical protein
MNLSSDQRGVFEMLAGSGRRGCAETVLRPCSPS